jgi:hypothetical protein
MRHVALSLILALATAGAAQAAAPKPVNKATKPFGLTEALAVLNVCPDARFDGASIIALGGVLQENKARIDAAPVAGRMDLMNQLVAEESHKAAEYVKTHKVDCANDPEKAAAYWNGLIRRMAAEQQVSTPAAAPNAGEFKLTNPRKEPVSVKPGPQVPTPVSLP